MHLSTYVNINGNLLPASETLPAHDNRAFRYGYGIFETMLFIDGHIRLKQYHWERLFAGMRQIHFEVPDIISPEWLETETIKTVQKNKLEKLCRVRLQVYADSGGLYNFKTQRPGFVIECFPLQPAAMQWNDNGLVLGIANGLQKSPDALSNLKTCSSLLYTMAAQQAIAEKWNDALICNTNDHIIESTIANLFWIKEGQVFTPPLSDGCIAGIMRRFVITQLAEKGTHIHEVSLTKDTLTTVDELFLTNAIRGIKWVRAVDDIVIPSHKMTKAIAAGLSS